LKGRSSVAPLFSCLSFGKIRSALLWKKIDLLATTALWVPTVLRSLVSASVFLFHLASNLLASGCLLILASVWLLLRKRCTDNACLSSNHSLHIRRLIRTSSVINSQIWLIETAGITSQDEICCLFSQVVAIRYQKSISWAIG
jgi:hypothetical protein